MFEFNLTTFLIIFLLFAILVFVVAIFGKLLNFSCKCGNEFKNQGSKELFDFRGGAGDFRGSDGFSFNGESSFTFDKPKDTCDCKEPRANFDKRSCSVCDPSLRFYQQFNQGSQSTSFGLGKPKEGDEEEKEELKKK